MVLVTGASSGIGMACADLLARRGFRVYGASRTAPEPEHAFRFVEMDVEDDASVAGGVARVLEREGRIDAAVNCAVFGIAGAVEDTSVDEARRQFETNFFGVLRVCRAVLPAMRERRAGTIVNVSSIAGRVPLPFQAFYSASKFALEGMSEALRMEVRPFGIRVVLVEPGNYRTRFTANRRAVAAAAHDASAYRPWFSAAMEVVEAEEMGGWDPQPVARVVERVLRAGAPGVRYSVGPAFERLVPLARSILPHALYEALIRRHYRLR